MSVPGFRSGLLRHAVQLATAALLATVGACGAGPDRPAEAPDEALLARMDSLLVDLGGPPLARMDRGQRWRTLASVGTGLPPANYTEADLPEPGSYGAGLLQVYCDRCHWIPAPAMHAADEWPLLLRRMQLRAATVQRRLGGPLTEGVLGELMVRGLATTELRMAATPAQLDSLVAYLQRNALPTVRPERLPEGPGRELFRERCSLCHELPSPDAHDPAGWREVVARMSANMPLMSVEPLTEEERRAILGYLGVVAGGMSSGGGTDSAPAPDLDRAPGP